MTWLSSLLSLGLLLRSLLLLHALHHRVSLGRLDARDDSFDWNTFLSSLLCNLCVENLLLLQVVGLDLFDLGWSRLLAGLNPHAWGQWDAHRHALTRSAHRYGYARTAAHGHSSGRCSHCDGFALVLREVLKTCGC